MEANRLEPSRGKKLYLYIFFFYFSYFIVKLKILDGSCLDYRIATLSKLYPDDTEIIMQSLRSILQF